jgi:FlaA1/EpsC-like NDP-sugar epimerase
MNKNILVVIGAGSIGQAIVRRIVAGKHILLADIHEINANKASVVLSEAGFEVSTAIVDVSSRQSVLSFVTLFLKSSTRLAVSYFYSVAFGNYSISVLLKALKWCH